VSIKISAGAVPLATLGRGEIFGELALLSEGSRRTATVTALEALPTYSLSRSTFQQLLKEQPAARAVFGELAENPRLRPVLLAPDATPIAALGAEEDAPGFTCESSNKLVVRLIAFRRT
jgi:hypothetical protein